MYRRMDSRQIERELEEVRIWRKMKDILPEEFKDLYLVSGKLSDQGLKSEYERGFVDCWNRLVLHCY